MRKAKMRRFKRYLRIGKKGEDRFIRLLEKMGFQVVETGQEHWLPKRMHSQLLRMQDETARFFRHTPDLLTYHPKLGLLSWDVKVNTDPDRPYYTLNKAFHQAMMQRYWLGQWVVIAFLDTDGEIYCQWAHGLEPAGDRGNYILINKASTMKLGIFLAVNTLRLRPRPGYQIEEDPAKLTGREGSFRS